MRKVSRKAVSHNFIWNPRAKELSGRGLGRSLSYVGHNQISLFVMLHAALVHKLPYELFLEPLHGTGAQKLPFEAISQAFSWNCRANVVLRGYLSRWNVDRYSRILRCAFK